MTDARRPGALVLSLDLELHWGVRDHTPPDAPTLHGAREAVRRLLTTFAERDVACTWATVGLLFAATRAEQEAARPALRPAYADPRLDAYAQAVGADEAADPVHFGASLVEAIRSTPRQELATHTFAHYYCGEPGATPASFRADLEAAQAIAGPGRPLRSIVFPRNQVGDAYVRALPEAGFDVFRGTPPGGLWQTAHGATGRQWHRRLGRLLDAYLPIDGDGTVPWASVLRPDGLADVRASALLRPYDPRRAALDPLRLRRIASGLEAAARTGAIYHLWWHPHNFGTHLDENLRLLDVILDVADRLRESDGLQSLTMAEAADQARAVVASSTTPLSALSRRTRG